MKALGILLSTFIIAVMFNACDGAIFSSSSSKTAAAGGPNTLGDTPTGEIPGFGDVIACNANLVDIPDETLEVVGCDTAQGEAGIYLCRLPLDGVSQVETLCLTPEVAAMEVYDSCDCTIIPDEEGGHYSSNTFGNHHWWKKWKKKRHHDHDCDSDDDSSDGDSSDDDSSDDGGGTEVCVPSTTVQYRLGNCADLF